MDLDATIAKAAGAYVYSHDVGYAQADYYISKVGNVSATSKISTSLRGPLELTQISQNQE